ncbi:MAG: hypothetical protein NTW86_10395 [Candidatus Sumerlaeota bacterium]|nr:hypothetical protein [Candidatus Sumerlaeota bacterium]
MRDLMIFLFACLSSVSWPASFLFDAGPDSSAVMDGFTRLTPKDAYAPEKGYGWDSVKDMKASAKAYKEPIANKKRGQTEPPPIYTNPLTEDCIIGKTTRTFRLDLPAGEYNAYFLCGNSAYMEGQYFDFQVKIAETAQRVRIENGQQFRNTRFSIRTGGEPLNVVFEPRSKWVLNGILVWDKVDDARVSSMIKTMEEQVYSLPPEEWAQWKQDPLPRAAPMPEEALADEDRSRGFVIFRKPWPECVYPNTTPYPHELHQTLRIFVSPGEYEPLTFEVRALRALANVRVAAEGIGPISSGTIDVRHVRYMKARPNYDEHYSWHIVPDVLEHFDAIDLPADETHRFWLTVRAPEDAAPGLYSGYVDFACQDGHGKDISVRIPVELRILDIQLREDPDKIYGIYYDDPIDQWVNAQDAVSKEYFWRKSEMEHADMAAHGIRNVTLDSWVAPEDKDGHFKADWTALDAKIQLARKYDFRPPFVLNLSTERVYKKYMNEEYGNHLAKVRMPPQAFFDEMTRLTAFVESERVQHGWPEFLYYPIDEPGQSDVAIQFMAKLLKAVRKAGVKTYVTADPTNENFEPLRPFVDVWCTQPFSPDRETIMKDIQARGVQYWCYPNHVSGENDHTPVAGARMTFGFGFWRSGFKALIPWIYSASDGDPFNYLDGPMMDFLNRHEDDGAPVPVALWEAYREGYDDYRYVYTLESMIAEARAAGGAEAADQAERELRSAWNAVAVQEKYKYDLPWAPEEFDVYRWLIARAILRLQESASTDP